MRIGRRIWGFEIVVSQDPKPDCGGGRRLAALVLLAFASVLWGYFAWALSRSESLSRAVLGPGMFGWLPAFHIYAAPLVGGAGVIVFSLAVAAWLARRTDRHPSETFVRASWCHLPSLLLALLWLPASDVAAPFLLVLVAGGYAFALTLCWPIRERAAQSRRAGAVVSAAALT